MTGIILKTVLELAGAIAIFLYGMQLTSEGIQRGAGERLQKTVNFMTSNRLMGILTGIVVTVLVQSSSVTTVMVVSFVNAGLLSLVQAVGVIMGANIGTTLTGWIIAAAGIGTIDIILLAIPLFGFGFFFSLIKGKNVNFGPFGESLMGLAIIFLGLGFLTQAIPAPGGEALMFLQNLDQSSWGTIIVCVLIGMVFTMLVSASSATLAITIGMAAKGVIGLEMAAALSLGANIGTTFNTFIASLRSNANAKRAAWAHILFNVFGTLWVLMVFRPFLRLVDWILPGQLGPASMGVYLAMFHTIFNLANTVVIALFVKQFAAFLAWLVRSKPGELTTRHVLHYSAPLTGSPELNLVSARKEISDMTGVVKRMFMRFIENSKESPQDMDAEIRWFKAEALYISSMHEELSRFLLETLSKSPAERTQENIYQHLRVVGELENISGACINLITLLERRERKKLTPSKGEASALESYFNIALDFIRFIEENANKPITKEQLDMATDMEESIDKFRDDLRKKARKKMAAGADIRTGILYIDMVRNIEKIGDYAYSVAGALRAMS